MVGAPPTVAKVRVTFKNHIRLSVSLRGLYGDHVSRRIFVNGQRTDGRTIRIHNASAVCAVGGVIKIGCVGTAEASDQARAFN